MSVPSILYVAFVAAAALVALAERAYAARNERRLLSDGASEIAPGVFRLMVPVYSAVFVAAAAEHLLAAGRPASGWVAAGLAVFAAAKALKLWAVAHLGGAWTMKVLVPRTLRVVTSGPYRRVRHPNYVAVMGEVVGLPLAGGSWATAVAAGVLFAALLAVRVRTEEEALMRHPGYAAAMGGRRRFIPGPW